MSEPFQFESTIIAAFVHDLRNPLSAISTNVDYLLTTRDLSADARDALQDTHAMCVAQRLMLDNLAMLAGAISSDPKLTDLDACLAAAIAENVSRAQLEGLEIEKPSGVALGRHVVREAPLLLGIRNLMANAIEHAPRGSSIRVEAESSKDGMALHVYDSGPAALDGAVATTLEAQLHQRSDPKVRYGRGMGLYCASRAAKLAGGTLAFRADGNANVSSISFRPE